MAKENRFAKNHPPVDPNDPAVLITAGLIGPQESALEEAEPAQEPVKEEAPVVTPAEPEKPQEKPESKSVGFDLDKFIAEQKQENKNKQNRKGASYTLSPVVRAEIERLHKLTGKSRSSIIDDLLKQVLKLN